MNIMMSIKPEYAERILNGTKRYEFRKRIPKDLGNVDRIYIYATAPIQKVVGFFYPCGCACGTPSELYEETKWCAGIEKDAFMNYFNGCKKAYAICISRENAFLAQSNLSDFGIKRAPQSWCYIKGAQS